MIKPLPKRRGNNANSKRSMYRLGCNMFRCFSLHILDGGDEPIMLRQPMDFSPIPPCRRRDDLPVFQRVIAWLCGICLGITLIALAYHQGERHAQMQAMGVLEDIMGACNQRKLK